MKLQKLNNHIHQLICLILWAALVASCSTTRRLAADDILYTGVKKIEINTPSKEQKKAPGLSNAVFDAVNVAPNNCLYSPYLRHPFPVGLWVYNNWNNPPSGFRHWLYEKLVSEPVLISDVRPDLRVQMLDQILANNGYFSGNASYELIKGKNKKKARILYTINTGPEYTFNEIRLLPDTCTLNNTINSIASKTSYLKPGSRYCIDSLSDTRINIANALRNKGYYFFKPEFIEYLADTTASRGQITLQLTIAPNTPAPLLSSYKTGSITTVIHRNEGGGTPDTIQTQRGTIIQMKPSKLREGLIPECITFRQGQTFSVRDMNRTQTYLSRLGIFSSISIDAVPSATNSDLLDVKINCTFDAPLVAAIEVNATSKSNSYIGPGLNLSLTHKNTFGGGEQLSANLFGNYEWQTGHGRSSKFNSYEVGLTTSLSFPRLLAPKFIPRSRRQLNWTHISLGAELLNRPKYFNLAQFNAAFSYDWRVNRHASSSLTLFKITYNNLMHTTTEFDSIMNANQAIAQSFMSQFIPQISYTYTYDRTFGRNNSLNWQISLQEAGNIFWGIYEAFGQKGEKKLFGTPFSQFIKAHTQLVYNRRLSGEHKLVGRVALGAAHAYGNSAQVPYSEQFYVGGANSIRAFTVRSIGPGSYRVPQSQVDDYFDQTGTFKFEFNLEYRFPIIGIFHGAMFIDAGNVWLLKDDPERPGGNLKASNFLKEIALGTGVGLRLDLGMLVVRGDLGIGIHAPYKTERRGYYNMPKFKESLAFHLAIGYPF